MFLRLGFALLASIALLPLTASAAAFAHEESDLPADPAVRFGVLDSGFRYVIMPNTEPPGRVSLRLRVGAGSLHETEEQRGLAHFLEHMAFKGSENYSPGELITFLQSLGMAFGPDTNAYTSFTETVYKLELPENTAHFLGEGLQVLRDYADRLLIRTEEIEPERGVILAEKRDRDSSGYRRSVAVRQFLFPETIIPQRFPIGLREVIETAGRDLFVDFYETWYRADNMALIVAGDVDPEVMSAEIRSHFDTTRRPDEPLQSPQVGNIFQPEFAAHFHGDRELPATRVTIFMTRAFSPPADSLAVRSARIHQNLALAILNRRISRLAETPEAVFSEGAAFHFNFLDVAEISGIELVTQAGHWQETLTVAENELRRALQYGFTTAEMEEAVASQLAAARQAVAAAATRRSRDLADLLARSIADHEVFLSPQTNLEVLQTAVAGLTPDILQDAFRSLWSEEGRSVFVSGPFDLEDSNEAIHRAFLHAAAQPVEPAQEEALADWPYSDFGPAGAVVSQIVHEDLGIHQWVLSNGVRFNFKRTDFEAGQVRVAVRLGDGSLALPEDELATAMLAQMAFIDGGLGAYNRDQLQRVLAGWNVSINFSVEQDHFRLNGVTTPEHLHRQLELLSAFLTDAAFRPEAFARAHRRLPEIFLPLTSTIEGVMRDQVERLLSGGSARFGFPDQQAVLNTQPEAVEAFLQPALQGGYLEVSVVGDVDLEIVGEQILRTLGALPTRSGSPGNWPEARRSVRFPSIDSLSGVAAVEEGGLINLTVDSELPRAHAAVFWPTVDMKDIHEVRRLNVLAQVVRERLRQRIREEMGDAYSPSSFNNSSEIFEDFGWFRASNGANAGQAAAMAVLVREIANSVAETGIDAEEFQRAIQPLLSFLGEYRRQNTYWLHRVLLESQAGPHRIEWARHFEDDYRAMTAEQITETARRHLGPGRGLGIAIEPIRTTAE